MLYYPQCNTTTDILFVDSDVMLAAATVAPAKTEQILFSLVILAFNHSDTKITTKHTDYAAFHFTMMLLFCLVLEIKRTHFIYSGALLLLHLELRLSAGLWRVWFSSTSDDRQRQKDISKHRYTLILGERALVFSMHCGGPKTSY